MFRGICRERNSFAIIASKLVFKMVCIQQKWISVGLCLFATAVFHPQRVMASDVTYEELIELKAACGDLDSCQGNRTTDDLRVVNCQCGPICAQLGTCCVDSEYRTLGEDAFNGHLTATKLYRNPSVVFMVNDCKPDFVGDKAFKELCEISTNQAYPDPFLLIPVTNTRTGITYKNYYCFGCNEDESSDSPVLWELKMSHSDNISLGFNPDLRFDNVHHDYMVKDYEVYIAVGVPDKIAPYLNWYRQDVISTCAPDWTDVAIQEKCEAYTAMVYFYVRYRSPIYKNPHCAICNHRSVSGLVCSEPIGNEVWGGFPTGHVVVGSFSFENIVNRCPQNEVFDRFAKKCRVFRCGKNQKLVNGKCEDGSLVAEPSPATSLRESATPSESHLLDQMNDFGETSSQSVSTAAEFSEETEIPTTTPL